MIKKLFVGKFIILLSAILFFSACESSKDGPSKEEYTEFKGQSSGSDQKINLLKAKLFDDPENFELLSALGDSYFEYEKYIEAIGVYDRILKIKPKNAETLNELALAYFYTGDSEKAFESAKRAVASGPAYINARLTIGFISMSRGDFDGAVKHLEKVKEMDPGGSFSDAATNFLIEIEQSKIQKGPK